MRVRRRRARRGRRPPELFAAAAAAFLDSGLALARSSSVAVASIVEGDSGNSTFDVTDYVGMSRVLGFTLLVSVVDVILITAIATLTAFLYNLAAALLGGIEVTLAEDEK